MKARKNSPEPVKRGDVAKFQEERQGLEVQLIDEVLKSRRRAWQVCSVLTVITLLSLASNGLTIYRYSQPVPPNLMALRDNGEVTQIALTRQEASYGQAIDTYWVSQFIIHRETYQYSVQQLHYDAMALIADGPVADEYLGLYKGTNGMANRLKDSEQTTVNINSVLVDEKNGIATVRFTTTRRDFSKPLPDAPKHWIATVGYAYEQLPLNSQQRQINPLGLRVKSYDKHEESVGFGG